MAMQNGKLFIHALNYHLLSVGYIRNKTEPHTIYTYAFYTFQMKPSGLQIITSSRSERATCRLFAMRTQPSQSFGSLIIIVDRDTVTINAILDTR